MDYVNLIFSPIRTDVCLNPDSSASRKMLCWTLFLHAKGKNIKKYIK